MGTVAVLGLGPSLALFSEYPEQFDSSVGVNDIWSKVKADYVLCVDKPERFNADRLKVINECKPLKFVTHLEDYQNRPDYFKIDLLPYYPNYVCQLDLEQYPKSLCSPFIAAVFAYKYLHATEIHLFGVDLTNHQHLDSGQCERIKIHFRNLKIALAQKEVKLIVHGHGILKDL